MEETDNSNANSKPSSPSLIKRIASAFRFKSLFQKLSYFSHKIHSGTLAVLAPSRHRTEIQLLEDRIDRQQRHLCYYEDGKEEEEVEDNDYGSRYPDFTHSMFEEEENDLDEKERGGNLKLENEIDQVADLFITKFHKGLRLQKLESFKRYQEMLKRSV